MRLPRRVTFSLTAMLIFVGVVAGTLQLARRWLRKPMESGRISSALCYSQDWEQLTASLPSSQHGDFELRCFDVPDPAALFEGFSVEPETWGVIEIAKEVGTFWIDDPSSLGAGAMRLRPRDKPVVGAQGAVVTSPNAVLDATFVSGTFRRSVTWPTTYDIVCRIHFGRTGSTINSSGYFVLSYHGSPAGNLLVFSRPIDDELVLLLIVELQ